MKTVRALIVSMLTFILAWSVIYWGITTAVCLVFMDLDFMYSYPDSGENIGKGILIALSFVVAFISAIEELAKELQW